MRDFIFGLLMQRRKWADEETVNGTKKETRKTQRRQRKRREMKRVCYVSCCGKDAHGKCGEIKRGKDKEKEACKRE
jgi:hypothetical protein